MSTGLADASHETGRGEPVLSFDDLVSLEVVGRFRSLEVPVPLQKVRALDEGLRARYPDLDRPFAYKVFFTDGASVWEQEIGEDGPIATEVVGRRKNHRVWLPAIQAFAREIRYDQGSPPHAMGWTLSPWVEINPAVQFGAPVVRWTRVPVTAVVANLAEGSPSEVAEWYGLSVKQVLGAKDYAAAH